MFVLATLGYRQLGKNEEARAFIVPTLVVGILLLTIGIGIFYANKTRVTSFTTAYNTDASAFVKSEITRAEKSMGECRTIVFKVIPFIIIASALLIVFINKPSWRAISITTIAMMIGILFIDMNANARIEDYNKELIQINKSY